jgi:putative oxidoreductase
VSGCDIGASVMQRLLNKSRINILSFHILMAPSGLPLALFVAVLWAVIFVDVRRAFAALFQPRLQARV